MIRKNAIINLTKLSTGLIALLPVIMIYKFPFSELSCATVLVILFSYVFLLMALKGIFKDKRKAYGILLLFLYCAWAIYHCLGSLGDLILLVIIFIYITAIVVSNIFDVIYARKIVENIAVLAALIVMAQYILYYTVGLSSSVIGINNWIIESLRYNIGFIGDGLFRPSAFFSEPSHMADYSIIGLVSILFVSQRNKVKIKKALVITLGIFMTTSGIGIILGLISWGIWLFRDREKKMLNRIMGGLSVGALALVILMQFDFFTKSIQRVFGQVDNYNAISGRLFWWDTYFSNLSIHDWIFGFGYSALPHQYFTGFMEVVYATGIIGFVLLIMVLINCMLHTNGFSFILCGIYLGMLFIGNITNFIFMIFWFSFIFSGFPANKNKVT